MSWTFVCCTTVESDPSIAFACCPECGRVARRSSVRAAETRLINSVVKRAIKVALANVLVSL